MTSMTADSYPRPLQTALDDTLGTSPKVNMQLDHSLGETSLQREATIYDASDFGPDLWTLNKSELSNT